MPVLEVGIGVGYLRKALDPFDPSRACLFTGRGRPGEEDRGSNGGRSEGAGRLVPAILEDEELRAAGGRDGSVSSALCFPGEEFILLKDEEAFQKVKSTNSKFKEKFQ
jgi:hypothetical protein